MRKLLIALMLAVLALQAHAYIYEGSYWSTSSTVKSPTLVLSRPGTTAKALIVTDWRRIDVNGLERHINEVLADNRSGCQALASYFGRTSHCRTYIDFPLSRYGAYGTLRVYSGIERVSVGITRDCLGRYWLTFAAVGYAKPQTASIGKTWQNRRSDYKQLGVASRTFRKTSLANNSEGSCFIGFRQRLWSRTHRVYGLLRTRSFRTSDYYYRRYYRRFIR